MYNTETDNLCYIDKFYQCLSPVNFGEEIFDQTSSTGVYVFRTLISIDNYQHHISFPSREDSLCPDDN